MKNGLGHSAGLCAALIAFQVFLLPLSGAAQSTDHGCSWSAEYSDGPVYTFTSLSLDNRCTTMLRSSRKCVKKNTSCSLRARFYFGLDMHVYDEPVRNLDTVLVVNNMKKPGVRKTSTSGYVTFSKKMKSTATLAISDMCDGTTHMATKPKRIKVCAN